MKTVYGTYRKFHSERNSEGIPSFYLGRQFRDYAMAGIISLEDNIINEYNYTTYLSPNNKLLDKFIICSYDDTRMTDEKFLSIVDKVSSMNYINLFDTVELARQWIRDNTDLIETSTPGKFITALKTDASEEMEATEEQYLIIE